MTIQEMLAAIGVGVLLGNVVIIGLILIGHKTIRLPHGLTLGPAHKPVDPESDAWGILMLAWWITLAGAAIGLAVLL